MAHNLYKDTMVYTGVDIPWHGLGVHFDGMMKSSEAIEAAQLGYEVRKEQLYRKITMENGEKFDGLENAFATINGDTNKTLGIVGSDYAVVQNREMFAFFDEFVEKNAAIFETAGALGNGERIWMLARLPGSFEPIAGDVINQYCLLYGSHDGTCPVSVQFTPIRVVCQNTLNMAINKSESIVKVRHTKNASERLAEAGRILARLNAYYETMGEKMHDLTKFCIDDDFIEAYQNLLFGKEEDFEDRGRTIRMSKLQMFEGRRLNGMGVDIPGVADSAYGLLNAAIEYADYDMRNEGNVVQDILFGKCAKFKQKAFDGILQLVS